jgi:hypothetical protein
MGASSHGASRMAKLLVPPELRRSVPATLLRGWKLAETSRTTA